MALTTLLLPCLGGCGETGVTVENAGGYTTAAATPGGDTKAAIEHNRRGLELLNIGDDPAAEAAFKAALEADLFYAPAHNNLGSIYFRRGELYLAAWEFQYAARLNPGDARPHNNLGLIFIAAGKDEQALESFAKAHELQPDNAEITASLAKLRLQQGKTDAETLALLESLANDAPDEPLRNWAAQELMQIK